jgi:hypothetical protein
MFGSVVALLAATLYLGHHDKNHCQLNFLFNHAFILYAHNFTFVADTNIQNKSVELVSV